MKIKLEKILPMKVDILFFASLRELFEEDKIKINVDDDMSSPEELLQYLAKNHKGPWFELLQKRKNIRVAINHNIEDWDSSLSDGDELAFLPPITGG